MHSLSIMARQTEYSQHHYQYRHTKFQHTSDWGNSTRTTATISLNCPQQGQNKGGGGEDEPETANKKFKWRPAHGPDYDVY